MELCRPARPRATPLRRGGAPLPAGCCSRSCLRTPSRATRTRRTCGRRSPASARCRLRTARPEETRRATPHQASVLNPAAQVAAFINEETRVSATLCKLREVARRFAQPEAREDATRGGGALLQHTRSLTRPDGCAAQVLEKSLVRQGRAFVREGELTKVRLAHRQRRKAVLSSASRARLPLRHASGGRVLDVSSLGLPLLRPARVRRAHRARLRPKGPDPPRRGDAGERERVAAHAAPGALTRPGRAASRPPISPPPSHVP